MDPNWLKEFKENSIYRLDESERMIGRALEILPTERFWEQPNPSSNSVGNLLLHLCGNLRQYVVSGLGGAPDHRNRTREFLPQPNLGQQETWALFTGTLAEVRQAIHQAGEEEYLKVRSVQGFRLSGLGMVLHAVEHLSYHTGQIAYAVKAWENKDLGFYDAMDLNVKNED
ncbi:DinB family protein [Robiginitalea sp. M366]|uniref:DinB family protein n=1 Tax=Robiginitalea aestuariiviva TaxID=3036903 RepID=UPI00240CFBF5|nr:DinB family protein [Robiginitalea aestuariiviva]MDG1572960.1 DinB family protein [Robiginitalea aestuariiviva]